MKCKEERILLKIIVLCSFHPSFYPFSIIHRILPCLHGRRAPLHRGNHPHWIRHRTFRQWRTSWLLCRGVGSCRESRSSCRCWSKWSLHCRWDGLIPIHPRSSCRSAALIDPSHKISEHPASGPSAERNAGRGRLPRSRTIWIFIRDRGVTA